MAEDLPTQEEIEAWDRFEREFREHGFLATPIDVVTNYARRQMDGWFRLAEELNQLAQRMYIGAGDLLKGRSTHDPIAMGLQLMPRILSSFQGAILLAERGMGIEAQTLVRATFESAF